MLFVSLTVMQCVPFHLAKPNITHAVHITYEIYITFCKAEHITQKALALASAFCARPTGIVAFGNFLCPCGSAKANRRNWTGFDSLSFRGEVFDLKPHRAQKCAVGFLARPTGIVAFGNFFCPCGSAKANRRKWTGFNPCLFAGKSAT